MAKKFDLYEALKADGFYEVDDEFGKVLRKDYSKEVDVCWYGKQEKRYTVRCLFNESLTVVTVSYFEDGLKKPSKVKTHLNEKRAYNAIRETIKNNGFEI